MLTEQEMDYLKVSSDKDTLPEFSNHESNEIFSDYLKNSEDESNADNMNRDAQFEIYSTSKDGKD